jgi:hypothetical protein
MPTGRTRKVHAVLVRLAARPRYDSWAAGDECRFARNGAVGSTSTTTLARVDATLALSEQRHAPATQSDPRGGAYRRSARRCKGARDRQAELVRAHQ